MSTQLIDVSLLLVRVAVGIIMAAHGSQKLFGAFGGGGIEQVTGMLKGLGFIPPVFWAYVLALTEFAGGLFLMAGIIPRISASLIAVVMLVAVVKVHGPHGFFAANNGFEYPFMLLLAAIALALSGAGKFSVFNKF